MKKKVHSKAFNRTVSLICLAVFLVGLGFVGFGAYSLISLYCEQQELIRIKENLNEESQKQNQYAELKFDEYYSVYVEDGYALYNDTENDDFFHKIKESTLFDFFSVSESIYWFR